MIEITVKMSNTLFLLAELLKLLTERGTGGFSTEIFPRWCFPYSPPKHLALFAADGDFVRILLHGDLLFHSSLPPNLDAGRLEQWIE